MNKNGEKISITIICPVYNAKEYLSDTFKSIKQQTDKKFNVVLVDNCSSDGSDQMCDEFAKKWNSENNIGEVVAIHNESNRGISYSHEVGILSTKTPFFFILDSDDLIHPHMVEMANKIIEMNPSIDMLINKAIPMNSKMLENVVWKELDTNNTYFKDLSSLTFEERYRKYRGSIVNKFIRKDLIFSFDYNEIKEKCPHYYMDDGLFSDIVSHSAQNIGCIDAPVFYYRIRQGSTGANPNNLERQKGWVESDRELLQKYLDWGEITIYKTKLVQYALNVMKYYYILKKCKLNTGQEIKFVDEEFEMVKLQLKKYNCSLGFAHKVMFFLFGLNKNIVCMLGADIYFKYVQYYKRMKAAHKNYDFLEEK